MEEISQKLSEILQDPGRIQQIMEMASAMGFQTTEEDTAAEQPMFQEALQQVSQVLHQTEARDKRQQTLMRALMPYLSPKRKVKLERAMQISHLSRLAGAALQSSSLSTSLSEEEEFHV